MNIPTFEKMLLPLLEIMAKENRPLSHREYTNMLADRFNISEEERKKRLPSGSQTYMYNRATWAAWDLSAANLISTPKRGFREITQQGLDLLAENPVEINRKYLTRYPEYVAKLNGSKNAKENNSSDNILTASEKDTLTPEEQMEQAQEELNKSLASELLSTLAQVDPFRFEQIVIDLLFAMGYGGSREQAAQVTQKSNDEGIDGIINEDRLGLDIIYVQAKRWQANIGRKEIQSFVGALAGKQATKGIFITTSSFVDTAKSYVKSIPQKVILIDGERLTRLMIEFEIGVAQARAFTTYRLDSDYFTDT